MESLKWETDYRGIDYGHGTSNINPDTNIRYGVMPVREVLQAWCDSSEPVYEELENQEDEDEIIDREPVAYRYEDDEYAAEQWEGVDIFVMRSPYYTHAQFCSPCAPGAGHLMHSCKDGPKTYCFGHDWFEDGVAPYPVFDVRTGKIVEPPEQEE